MKLYSQLGTYLRYKNHSMWSPSTTTTCSEARASLVVPAYVGYDVSNGVPESLLSVVGPAIPLQGTPHKIVDRIAVWRWEEAIIVRPAVRWASDASWEHKIYHSSLSWQYAQLFAYPFLWQFFLGFSLTTSATNLGVLLAPEHFLWVLWVLAWNCLCHLRLIVVVHGFRVFKQFNDFLHYVAGVKALHNDRILKTCRLLRTSCVNGRAATEV